MLLVRLITTNHWTTGKKNLVAIIASMTWKTGVEVAYASYLIEAPASLVIIAANIPLILSIFCIILIVHWFND